MVVAYIRTVKTASKATAVQIVHYSRKGSRDIEHLGSAHTAEGVEVLKTVARQRLHANQDSLIGSLSSLLCKAGGFGHRWGLIRSG